MPLPATRFRPLPGPRIFPAAALLLLAFSLATPTTAAIYTVGGDAACDYTDLQTALNVTLLGGDPIDEIRVARNQTYVGEFFVEHQSVRIVGGYDSCSDPTPFGRTRISRPDGSRALSVRGDLQGSQGTVLRGLYLDSAGSPQTVDEGGILHVSGPHTVLLDDTVVHGGRAILGGGIYVDGSQGAFLHLDGDSAVEASHATSDGGGIHCSSGGAILLEDAAEVSDNEASYGGGLFLTDCDLTMTTEDTTGPGILANESQYDGAGLYVQGDALAFLVRARIESNTSHDRGGGVFASGSEVEVHGRSLLVRENAAGSGGAVFLETQAELDIRQAGSGPIDLDLHNAFVGNQSTGSGGALFVQLGAHATVRQARFSSNLAGSGAVAISTGLGSRLELEGVVLDGNQAHTMIQAWNRSVLDASHLTIGENFGQTILEPWNLVDTSSNGVSRVGSSVFAGDVDDRLLDPSAEGTSEWHCVLVRHAEQVLAGGDFTVVDVPFADDDYRLPPGSPAIDRCTYLDGTPQAPDATGAARGYDDPSVTHGSGRTYDAGAFERVGLFADGFESGSVSAWSTTP